jgi:hypothetical protein
MKYTWLAIPVTLLATVPGLVLGGVVKFLYLAFVGPMIEGGILNWLSDGFAEKLFTAIVPEGLHGAVAGYFGIVVVHKFLKQADYNVVAYAVTSIAIVFSLIALGFSASLLSLDTAGLIANTIGLAAGLFAATQSLPQNESAGAQSVT